MRIFLLLALGSTMFVSCTNFENVAENIDKKNPVQFRGSVDKTTTRGVGIDNSNIGNVGNTIGLWAYRGTDQMPIGSDITIASNAHLTAASDISGIVWTLTKNDGSPLELLWPGNEDKLSFFAYYPAETAGNGITNVLPAEMAATDAPSFEFAVAPQVSNQIDLLAARNIPQGTGSVLLQMHHILSKVSFKARTSSDNYRVNITYIGIENVMSKAKYSFSTQSGSIFTSEIQNASWSGHNTLANYDFAMVSNPVVLIKKSLPNDYQNVSSLANALYLLPQDLKTITPQIPYFVITYSIDNITTGNEAIPSRTVRMAINSPTTSESGQLGTVWSAGTNVIYYLDFTEATSGAGSPVSFNVLVSPWFDEDFPFN